MCKENPPKRALPRCIMFDGYSVELAKKPEALASKSSGAAQFTKWVSTQWPGLIDFQEDPPVMLHSGRDGMGSRMVGVGEADPKCDVQTWGPLLKVWLKSSVIENCFGSPYRREGHLVPANPGSPPLKSDD